MVSTTELFYLFALGDGVEEAFYTTDRVMTCSFHMYGEFFPGSGDINEIGTKSGKNYSVNFPLKEGLDDEGFEFVYKPVLDKIYQVYNPNVVVMCCGADSISGDRLGVWNLSLKGHASAVEYIKKWNIPLVLLGGGGYTPRNVARCWTYETALALNKHHEISEELPTNKFIHQFGQEHRLHIEIDQDMKNLNDRRYMEKCTGFILEQLSRIQHVPSVQMQEVDSNLVDLERFKRRIDLLEEKATENAEKELKQIHTERHRQHQAEFFEEEKSKSEL